MRMIKISTHMPLARHDGDQSDTSDPIPISTHMPLARHDGGFCRLDTVCGISTHMPLARHDTNTFFKYTAVNYISTHMPLARHDCENSPWTNPPRKFLLTCLLRGMTERTWDIRLRTKFLLTCLLRGMTYLLYDFLFFINISTHMPLARHDDVLMSHKSDIKNFYSHASCEA